MDWDGDNVLADGGIIDYGSVRQFGLYHREYRFDDGGRWSTTIPEQQRMARLIVQNFAQIRDYLTTGEKTPLASFRNDPVLLVFDEEFETWRLRLLLRKVGFRPRIVEALLSRHPRLVRRFQSAHAWFEHARSSRGRRRVADGVTWNAIYSSRDLLRDLPPRTLESGKLDPREILAIASSSYASRRDRRATPNRLRRAREFQVRYFEMMGAAARLAGVAPREMLRDVADRSSVINRYARITGDAATYAAQRLNRWRRQLSPEEVFLLIHRFAAQQTFRPGAELGPSRRPVFSRSAKRLFDALLDVVADCRHGL
jgi:hypothetical protein